MVKSFEYCNSIHKTSFDVSEDGVSFILVGTNAATFLGRLLSPSSIFPFKAMSSRGHEYSYSSFNAFCVSELRGEWSKDNLKLVGEQASSQYNLLRYVYVEKPDRYIYNLSGAWFDFLNTPLQSKYTPGQLLHQLNLPDLDRQTEILEELKKMQVQRDGEITLAMALFCIGLPVLHGRVEDGMVIPDEAELFIQLAYEKSFLRLNYKAIPVPKTPVKSTRRRV